MWFEKLTGFCEKSPEQVRENIMVNNGVLTSQVNGTKYTCGLLEIPSLAELRNRVQQTEGVSGKISVREIVADVQQLHTEKANTGALFQVASQFNLLEMPSPGVTPEQGVDSYEYDHTQGPACAIAAGAGTIYRNYFVEINGAVGQTAERQIDCLADIGAALRNTDSRLWQMKNGYALATEAGLLQINKIIHSGTEADIDNLRELLRIGVQWNTEVTLNHAHHTVAQAYCSALPVAYSQPTAELWGDFATLVLEASYEATICAGILNFITTGNNTIYLTLVGGGVFGNETDWIISAIKRSLDLYADVDLDVAIVSHGHSKHLIQELTQLY
jgi:hypothetical protein